MSEPEGFVNRHGHRTDGNAVDLSSLSIDKQPPSAPEKKPVKSKPTKSPKRRRRHHRPSKRALLIIGLIILVIIAVPIIIGEVLRAQYLASADAATHSLKSLIASDVLPQQKAATLTSQQLAGTIDKLESIRDGMCPGALLDNLATLYPRANDAHSTCIDERRHIASLVTGLTAQRAELVYSEAVDAALVQVTAPTTDAFAVISAQQDNWKSASDALHDVNPPTELSEAHTKLLAGVATITDGWSKLNVANNNQNVNDFTAAEKQLESGYEAVRASRDAYASVIMAEQATITTLALELAS